jgi:adenine-specific DNA-methyltransferase
MSEDIRETPGYSPNFRTELAAKLAEIVPEAVADGKIDVVKLKELLAEDVADETERFGLFWPGKRRALRAAQEPTTATLRPDKANSKDWDTSQNVFIEGDNLEVLKILQKHYHNKIKLIYIDPPYNTGKDFVYPDNYKEGLETYLEWTRQVNEEGKKVSTNSESEGRYHSNWLNMMYPRLKLARNLLTNDGIICISIDDAEQANLKRLCDEVFGENNFVASIVRSTGTTTGQGANIVGKSYDFILVYARSDEFIVGGMPLSEKDISRYKNEDDSGKYSTLSLRRTGNGDRREDRPKMYFPIEAPDGTKVYPKGPTGYESRWRVGQATYERMKEQGLIEWKQDGAEWTPHYKFYLEGRMKPFSNWWSDIEGNKKASIDVKQLLGDRVFETPKPVELIYRLAQLANTSNDDIVLDFFSGSGTTAHAILKLNADDGGRRKIIQVQLPEPTDEGSEAFKAGFRKISQITRERTSRAGAAVLASKDPVLVNGDSSLDVGFRAYILRDTNFAKWRVSSDTDKTALEQHLFSLRESASNDANADDLLIEILLKQGYSLTEKITESIVSGLEVRIVGENLVIAYLTESVKPTLDQLRALVDQESQRIIILEDAFHGDDELKTNLAQLCESKGIELWTA